MHGDAAAQHPTKAAIFMQDPVLTLEMRSQSLFMGCDLLFDALAIRVMDPVKPFFGLVSDLVFLIAQHSLPARREMNNIGRQIPVPQAIVGAASSQGVAFFTFLQCLLRLLA